MDEWRVFWHPGSTRFDTARDTTVSLDHRDVPTEAEARKLITQLQHDGRGGLSVSPPGNSKVLKGPDLRDWLMQADQ